MVLLLDGTETLYNKKGRLYRKNRPKSKDLERLLKGKLEAVELLCDAALLVGSVVLVEDTLAHGLVDGGNGNLGSSSSGFLITGSGSSLELLDVGLQQRLVSLVTIILDFGDEHSLLGRFNVRHENTSSTYQLKAYYAYKLPCRLRLYMVWTIKSSVFFDFLKNIVVFMKSRD
jgi:hypothetical protein